MEVAPDAAVSLRWKWAWRGHAEGAYRLDVLTLAEGEPPELVHQVALEGPGPFQLSLPAGFGEVHLVAYLDRNDNRPSPGEPVAVRGVQVGQSPLSGLALTLSTSTDLGPLAPGAPPPKTAGPPPEEEGGSLERSSQAAAGR